MAVDLWSSESRLYAEIDATGAQGKAAFKKRFVLGDGHNVQVDARAFTGILGNHKRVNPEDLKVGINFWRNSDLGPYYRLDFHKNPTDAYLHEHFASGTQTMDEHLPLSGTPFISECISIAFNKAEEIMSWKFPETFIASGTGFSGFI